MSHEISEAEVSLTAEEVKACRDQAAKKRTRKEASGYYAAKIEALITELNSCRRDLIKQINRAEIAETAADEAKKLARDQAELAASRAIECDEALIIAQAAEAESVVLRGAFGLVLDRLEGRSSAFIPASVSALE